MFVLISNSYLPILKPAISHNAVLRPMFPFIEDDVLWWASLQCFSNSDTYLQSHVADSSYSLHVCSSVPRRCGEVLLVAFKMCVC